MQVRKLIRLLNEMVEKNHKVAYMRTCVDKRYAQSNNQYQFIEIPDIEIHDCIWKPDDHDDIDNVNTIEVVVLGNY